MNFKSLQAIWSAVLLCGATTSVPYSSARAADAPAIAAPAAPAAQPPAAPMPEEQLKSLVAPIALYPDPILSQVLVAATYPLEIVQAQQWLQQHSDLKGEALMTAAKQQNWDPSVQALIAFPDVLKRLGHDITWTTNLGNAFLSQQKEVMDAVQQLRASAEQSGKLASTEQEKVVNTTDDGQPVVEIEPANPDVLYIPDYDPAWVWGPAPYYYPYPFWYYPPRPYGGWCVWYPGISLGFTFGVWGGWGGWGWHPHWHDRAVFINHGFFNRYHFHSPGEFGGRGVSAWSHNPAHRMGVAYPNRALSSRFHAAPRFHPTVMQTQARFHAAAGRFGGRFSGSTYNSNRSAFGGMEQGRYARTQGSRGFSSIQRSNGGFHGRAAVGMRGVSGGRAAHGGGFEGGHGGSFGGGHGGGFGGGHH